MTNAKIADPSLAGAGKLRVAWAESRMPVLMALRAEHEKAKSLKGMRVAGCLHVTKETAVLVQTLIAAGAEISWSGCNPLSTQDDVAAALAADGISVYAWHGQSRDDFYWCIDKTLEFKPTLTLDDGADLIVRIHSARTDLAPGILGGTEETTTGVHRLRAMSDAGKLLYPIIAVNDAATKSDFDNVHGTGQSSIDGILRATSILLAGKTFVVAGYGHCGRGVASRARGMNCRVVVCEVDPINALRAAMDGFSVMPMDKAAAIGDVFLTVTGVKDIVCKRHFQKMKDGAIVCNAGHYDCEIRIPDLTSLAKKVTEIRPNNEEHLMADGRRIYLLSKGRLVNLAAAEGHPSEVMDMSFANQFLSLIRLAREGRSMEKKVYTISGEQDRTIASLKLATMGMRIDSLTPEQVRYQTDFSSGT
ncbi:MAG: adenosylhomocysteinase [Spirochaetes bacterium]|nr:adenosylhomocysteinase [Spirochaetota bacterium]